MAALLMALPGPAAAAPEADLWPRWQAHAPDSDAAIGHDAWAEFLASYRRVDAGGVARIAYGDVSESDREALDAYIERLSGVAISDYNRDVQFAYWVNLYNAVTVDIVLEHYPVDTIRKITPDSFLGSVVNSGPWDAGLVTVAGEELSLNDIEHRILRPIWQDPRIHYVVNCAAVGCPNLAAEPLDPARLDAQLDAAAKRYVNHARGAQVTEQGLVVSKIYTWYQADFGGDAAGVIEHLKDYAEPDLAEALDGVSAIADSRYDWSLNDWADAPSGG